MSDRQNHQTYYEILEVPPTAGPTEIYNAYQRARNTYSPSSPALYSMFSPEEAQQLLQLIEEAYQTLSHQARRREYDVKLGLVQPQAPLRSTKDQPVTKYSAEEAKKKVDENWVGPVKVVRSVAKSEDLPNGFARTRFSVYEINPEIEAEIANVQECDGEFLQKIRLYKGVSIEQMADEIRVSKSTLVALESNDIDSLPVPVFTRGFVVGVAKTLGLDEKKIADAYMKYFKPKKRAP